MKCLVDGSNLVFICWSVAKTQLKKEKGDDFEMTEESVPFFYHVLLRKFFPIFSVYKDVIIAMEGRNSTAYRKNIYPGYKENRKKRDDEKEYILLKSLFPKIEALLNLFHCKVIAVDNCEGDDVIYALTKKYTELGEEVLVISSDGDFKQLLNFFEGVQVYTPMFKKYLEKNENILMEKAIIGDASDSIPGLAGIGKKTLEKMLEDRSLWIKKMTPDNERIYETLLKIIDLSKYPKEYQDSILDKESKMEYNKFDTETIEAFFLDNKLNECLMNWGRNSSEIQLCLSSVEKVVDLDDFL